MFLLRLETSGGWVVAGVAFILESSLNYRFTKHGRGNLWRDGNKLYLCLIWVHKATNLTKTPFLAPLFCLTSQPRQPGSLEWLASAVTNKPNLDLCCPSFNKLPS